MTPDYRGCLKCCKYIWCDKATVEWGRATEIYGHNSILRVDHMLEVFENCPDKKVQP